MKILMTCDAVGGVWQYATDLARGLAGQGAEVVLAVLGPAARFPHDSGAAGRSEDDGAVTVIETGLPLDWLAPDANAVLAAGRAVAALAAEHGVDLIHLNTPALAAAGPFAAPVVAGAHGCVGTWFAGLGEATPADLAWHERLVRAGLHSAQAVITPSASYAAAVQRHYGLATLPQAIHNGRAPADLPNAAPADHVFTAGRLWDRVKNTPLLDAVAALLPVSFRAAGPTTAPHGETVTTRNLHLLGSLDGAALVAEYAVQPIFVSAARFEPFGLAVLEAAQAGCPLVLAGNDTFRELWTGAALFVADDGAAAYAEVIQRLRTDSGLRQHLAHAARLRATRYTVDAMASGTLALYRELLAVPARQAA